MNTPIERLLDSQEILHEATRQLWLVEEQIWKLEAEYDTLASALDLFQEGSRAKAHAWLVLKMRDQLARIDSLKKERARLKKLAD